MAEDFISLDSGKLWRKLIASLILAVALLSIDYRYALVDRAAPLVSLVTQPIIAGANAPQQFLEWLQNHYRSIEELIGENRRLRQQLLESIYQIQSIKDLEEENRRLRVLTELDTPQYSEHVLVAEVTQTSTRVFRQTITINRGSRHSVYVGQPVLDAHGVVGQTTGVGLFQSTVLLVTDISHALLVRNARTGDRYLAHGNGQGLTLQFVPRHNDLQPGDLLLTSGLDDTYPPEYLVGEVAQITAQPGRDFLEADVQAGAKLQRNREVLLVWHRQPKEEADGAE